MAQPQRNESIQWRSREYRLLRRSFLISERDGSYWILRRKLLEKRKNDIILGIHKASEDETPRLQRHSAEFPSESRGSLGSSRQSRSHTISSRVQEPSHSSHVLPKTKTSALKSLSEAYAFCGMHAIFDEASPFAVSCIAFAHYDSHTLAFGSLNGNLYLAHTGEKPHVMWSEAAHEDEITQVDFSFSNDVFISVSKDSALKMWSLSEDDGNGGNDPEPVSSSRNIHVLPLRTVRFGIPISCVEFHPLNATYVVTGLSDGQVLFLNSSTGRILDMWKGKDDVLSIRHDFKGKHVFIGDAGGGLTVLQYRPMDGRKKRVKKITKMNLSAKFGAIDWISYHERVISPMFPCPTLLLSCRNDALVLIRSLSLESFKKLEIVDSFPVSKNGRRITSEFCPLVSEHVGGAVAAGSSDGTVQIVKIDRGTLKGEVNELSGHSASVRAVQWAFDESILASSGMHLSPALCVLDAFIDCLVAVV